MTKPKPKPPPPPIGQPTPACASVVNRFQADCATVAAPDLKRPFTTIDEAIEGLLPFHILATEEGDEADLDEASDGQGANILCARRDAWERMCMEKSSEFHSRVEQLQERVKTLERQSRDVKRPRQEDEYWLRTVCSQEYKAWKAKE